MSTTSEFSEGLSKAAKEAFDEVAKKALKAAPKVKMSYDEARRIIEMHKDELKNLERSFRFAGQTPSIPFSDTGGVWDHAEQVRALMDADEYLGKAEANAIARDLRSSHNSYWKKRKALERQYELANQRLKQTIRKPYERQVEDGDFG